jgi:hypothetical protein
VGPLPMGALSTGSKGVTNCSGPVEEGHETCEPISVVLSGM